MLLLSCMSSLWIMDMNPLSDASLEIILPHAIGCLFIIDLFFWLRWVLGLCLGFPSCSGWELLSQASPCGESESRSVVSDSLRPHGLHSPWNFPGQNTGMGSLSLLRGIFPAGIERGSPTSRADSWPAEPPGKASPCGGFSYFRARAPEHASTDFSSAGAQA